MAVFRLLHAAFAAFRRRCSMRASRRVSTRVVAERRRALLRCRETRYRRRGADYCRAARTMIRYMLIAFSSPVPIRFVRDDCLMNRKEAAVRKSRHRYGCNR